MALFRVPYPVDSAHRLALFTKATTLLAPHGTFEGTPEKGMFRGKTPIGSFAGSYKALDKTAELEIEITEKPWIVSHHMLEHEVRKLFSQA